MARACGRQVRAAGAGVALGFFEVCASAAVGVVSPTNPPTAAEAVEILRERYKLADHEHVIGVEWKWYLRTPPNVPAPQAEVASRLPTANDAFEDADGTRLPVARMYRGLFCGDGRVRVDERMVEMTLGPPEAFWSVEIQRPDMIIRIPALRTDRGSFTRYSRAYVMNGPRDDQDLVAMRHIEMFPALLARRFAAYFQNAAAARVVVDERTGRWSLRSEHDEVRIDFFPDSGRLIEASVRLRNSDRRFVARYGGTLADDVYPAPHPLTVRSGAVLANVAPPAAGGAVYVFTKVAPPRPADAGDFEWRQFANRIVDDATGEQFLADGTHIEPGTKARPAPAPIEFVTPPAAPGQLPQAKTTRSALRQWLIGSGAVCAAIGLGLWLRRTLQR